MILGLLGFEPETINVKQVDGLLKQVQDTQMLLLDGVKDVQFSSQGAIQFHRRKTLPLHANGMTITRLLR